MQYTTRFETPVQTVRDAGVVNTTAEDAAATVAKLLPVLTPGETVTITVQP